MPSPELTKTDAVTVRRKIERADYRRASANAILDEALVAHVGISIDGQPFVMPMAFGRDGDRLILHGAAASRLLLALGEGGPVCVTVTIVDSVVLARSQFHTSMNYRSVVIVGAARRLRDPAEKGRAMKCLVEHVVPGRTAEARPPTDSELRQIAVVEIPIDTASVKVRAEGPLEEPDDLALHIWAGVLPVTRTFGTPEPDAPIARDADLPASLSPYRRPAPG